MKRFFLYIFFVLAVVVGLSGASTVSAVEEPNFDEILLAVADEDLSDEDRFNRASDALNRALTLSVEKVESLRGELTKREFEEGNIEKELQAVYLADLEMHANYYSGQLTHLSNLSTLDDVKLLARRVKEYRDTTYSSNIEDVVEFTLIFYNEEVLNVANSRFVGVQADVEELRSLGYFTDDAFSNELGEVNRLLEESRSLQAEARSQILNPSTSTEAVMVASKPTSTVDTAALVASSSVVFETSTDNTEGIEVVEESTPETPREMLEKSLLNIKEAYSLFVNISSEIQTALGLE